jgi:hypothetical protein
MGMILSLDRERLGRALRRCAFDRGRDEIDELLAVAHRREVGGFDGVAVLVGELLIARQAVA